MICQSCVGLGLVGASPTSPAEAPGGPGLAARGRPGDRRGLRPEALQEAWRLRGRTYDPTGSTGGSTPSSPTSIAAGLEASDKGAGPRPRREALRQLWS